MKQVFQASNILEAHVIAGLLQSEGIQAHVGGHFLQGAVGDLPAIDFALVYVPDQDVDKALHLIFLYENNQL